MAAARPAPPGALVTDAGLWEEIVSPVAADLPVPALFLDRDGVIVEEIGYLKRPEDVQLIDGAAALIAKANRRGLPVVIVSNQSGVGRGYFAWSDFAAVQARILDAIAADGALVNAVFACPHHPDAVPPYRHPDHPARKPGPAMLLRAAALLPIDLARSWIVGDRASDLAAGCNAGLAGGLLIASGYGDDAGERDAALQLAAGGSFRVCVAARLGDAAAILPLFGDHRLDR